MPPHEAAQSLWWFVLLCFVVIGIGVWRGVKEERKNK